MGGVRLTIDGRKTEVASGTSILEAARVTGIYIPTLCSHPDLPCAEGVRPASLIYQGDLMIENASPEEPGKGCRLCIVEVQGEDEPVPSCSTEVEEGMVVVTESERLQAQRQENLVPILARHPHACLTCPQQEGCSRTQCSQNVPERERCCSQFGHCELQEIVNYVGVSPAAPRWIPTNLHVLEDDPLFLRDYNLCIGCTRCIRACRDLRGVEAIGFVYDAEGLVQVGTLAPTLEESGCRFCTACVEVCPTGALIDKNARRGKKQEDLVPCREACPARVDVPGYLRLTASGMADEAHAVIREKVPLPRVLGRVCIRPCEDVCRRGEVNEPVSICALKRYAADNEEGLWKKNQVVKEDTGKKVAIVGSGPAGLTAAFYIRKQGHQVSMFEAQSKAGGMLRYGIPAYRLPRDVLDKEIKDILDLGIDFKPNKMLGKDFTLDGLKKEGFDAVFLGVGAQLSRSIPIEGSDKNDVLWGLDFLKKVAEGEGITLKDRVIVVGGGNVAVDVALTARRCGAREVAMVCLEAREEMPAHEREIKRAESEGVHIMPSWGPRKILGDNGRVIGLEIVCCTSVFDKDGNFAPCFDDSKTRGIVGDQVIMAISQASDLSFLEDGNLVKVDRGLILVDEQTLETGMSGVYAGGDVIQTPGSVIHAIATGRNAASSIDKALGGRGDIDEILFQRELPDPYIGREEAFASRTREKVPELEEEVRVQGFDEVVLGYKKEQALREAGRCLQCDLRLYIKENPSPPPRYFAYNEENILSVPESEGVFQLFDEDKNVLAIKGSPNMRKSLLDQLEENNQAAWFDFEENKMFSQRENELIQQYLQEHGEMPGGGASDLDDLF